MEKKRKRGRPLAKNPATDRILLRVTPDEKKSYKAKAKKASAEAGKKISLSAWLKGLADRES